MGAGSPELANPLSFGNVITSQSQFQAKARVGKVND